MTENQQQVEHHFRSEARALVMLITGDLAHEPDEHQVKALVQALAAAYHLGIMRATFSEIARGP